MIRHTAGTTPNHRSFFDQWLLAVSSDTSSGWAEWTGDSLRSISAGRPFSVFALALA